MKSIESTAEQLRRWLADKRAQRALLNEELAVLNGEREAHLSAPLCAADVKEFLRDYIDARGAAFPDLVGWGAMLDKVIYPERQMADSLRPNLNKPEPLSLRDVDASLAGSDSHFSFCPPRIFTAHKGNQNFADAAMYFFFGDLIKAKLEDRFDDFYPGLIGPDEKRCGGIRLEHRRAEIKRIEIRVHEIGQEIAQIDLEISTITIDPNAEEQTKARERAALARSEQDRNGQIVRAYNGRNAEELATRFGITPQQVEAIGNRPIF